MKRQVKKVGAKRWAEKANNNGKKGYYPLSAG